MPQPRRSRTRSFDFRLTLDDRDRIREAFRTSRLRRLQADAFIDRSETVCWWAAMWPTLGHAIWTYRANAMRHRQALIVRRDRLRELAADSSRLLERYYPATRHGHETALNDEARMLDRLIQSHKTRTPRRPNDWRLDGVLFALAVDFWLHQLPDANGPRPSGLYKKIAVILRNRASGSRAKAIGQIRLRHALGRTDYWLSTLVLPLDDRDTPAARIDLVDRYEFLMNYIVDLEFGIDNSGRDPIPATVPSADAT